MATATFPVELKVTGQNDSIEKTPISARQHQRQIKTLEDRDQYVLDFLSKFDALPIGSILPTTIEYSPEDMPNGWIWADGSLYSSDQYPHLWEAIKNSGALKQLSDYRAYVQKYFNGRIETPNHETPYGYYVQNSSRDFFVPTLNNIFLMPVTEQGRVDSGVFEPDTIRGHSHTHRAYPVNGANLNSSVNDIGIALTDRITDKYDDMDSNNITISNTSSENNNMYLGDETKPASIAYRFMIKADFTSFVTDTNVETSADNVGGYYPSIRAPLSTNIEEKIFPIPDPATGKIDVDWINTEFLAAAVVEAARPDIENVISETAVINSEVSYIPSTEGDSIPRANDGKLNPEYFNLVTTEQIQSLFM